MKQRVLKAGELRVSEPTTAIINALQATSGIYADIHDALCAIYDERDAIEIISTKLCPELTALESRIKDLLAISIVENISNVDSMTI